MEVGGKAEIAVERRLQHFASHTLCYYFGHMAIYSDLKAQKKPFCIVQKY
jgi:hypothetical protein